MVQAPTDKDYYSLLQVHPNASMQQIKKAYRQLAFRFHPDTNPGSDTLCDAIFRDITEAYQVLSDADLRRAYDKENYYTSAAVFYKNISEWVNRLEFLKKYVHDTDPFRINRDGMCYCVEILLEPTYLHWLKNEDQLTRQKTLKDICLICKPLSYVQCTALAALLNRVFTSESEQEAISSFLQNQQKMEKWQGTKVLIAFVVAVLSCFLIFMLTKS